MQYVDDVTITTVRVVLNIILLHLCVDTITNIITTVLSFALVRETAANDLRPGSQ
jgi:hypothetical protein